jgi:hypothetical protein
MNMSRILCPALVALCWSTPARAQWTTVATGVSHRKMALSGPRVAHVVKVDLCAPGVRMRATAPGEGPRTVSSFGALVKGVAAVNGDWPAKDGTLPLPSHFPRGLSVGDGKHFAGTVDPTFYGFFGFGHDKAEHSHMATAVGAPLPWMQDVVSGQPTLVWNGQAQNNTGGHCPVRHPRTAVGLDAAGTLLYLVVVDGRSSASIGMTCNELAAFFLQQLKAHSALLQDGGGSSTMWLAGKGVVNKPSDGEQRSLVNHWAVLASSAGPPRSCVTREKPKGSGAVKRHVPNMTVFNAWKFAAADVIPVSSSYLSSLKNGPALGAKPELVQNSSGKVFLKEIWGTKRHVPNPYAMKTWRFVGLPIATLSAAKLAAMPDRPRLTYTPVLVKGSGPAIYLVDFHIAKITPPTPKDAGVPPAAKDSGSQPLPDLFGRPSSELDSASAPDPRGADAGAMSPMLAMQGGARVLQGGCSMVPGRGLAWPPGLVLLAGVLLRVRATRRS